MVGYENIKRELAKLNKKYCCLLAEIGALGGFEVVENYSALPLATTVPDSFYFVSNSQGTWWLPGNVGGTFYSKGIYYSNGVDWIFAGDIPYQATQAEVNAGAINDKFVTPLTLATSTQWSTKANVSHTHPQSDITNLVTDLGNKQDTLVSATNIKTINGSSILGVGDLVVSSAHTFIWAQLRNTDEARAAWVSTNNSEAQFIFEHAEGVSGITYTTSQITVDTTGNYKISYSVNGPLTAATVINVRLKVDGSEITWLRGTDREATLGYSVSISNSGILTLTAGQAVTLWFFTSSSCAFGGAGVLMVEKL